MATVQVAQCKVSNNADASVTTQALAAVIDSGDKCIILITVDSIFWMFFDCRCCSCNSNR